MLAWYARASVFAVAKSFRRRDVVGKEMSNAGTLVEGAVSRRRDEAAARNLLRRIISSTLIMVARARSMCSC